MESCYDNRHWKFWKNHQFKFPLWVVSPQWPEARRRVSKTTCFVAMQCILMGCTNVPIYMLCMYSKWIISILSFKSALLSSMAITPVAFALIAINWCHLLWATGPEARFSKVPKTFFFGPKSHFRNCQPLVFWKTDLLTCFQGNKKKNDCQVWWLKSSPFLRYRGNCDTPKWPLKFRDIPEMGPRKRRKCWLT